MAKVAVLPCVNQKQSNDMRDILRAQHPKAKQRLTIRKKLDDDAPRHRRDGKVNFQVTISQTRRG